MFELEYLLAGVATALLHQGHESVGYLAAAVGVILFVEPLSGERLDGVAAVGAVEQSTHVVVKTGTHLFVGDGHTEAEFAEVLEEGVGPCRTASVLVLCVGSRGHRA